MDLQGKPSYQENGCPVCASWIAGECAVCHKQIPRYASESGTASPVMINDGFKSPDIDHWHLTTVEGVPGYSVMSATLCREDYFEAYTAAFPDRTLTIDELPKEITYT